MSLVRSLRTKAVYDNPVTIEVDPSTFRGGWQNPHGVDWFFGNNGIDYHFSYTGHESSLKAYQMCAPLTAIINKQASSYIRGKTWVLNTQGKAKGKESTSEFAGKVKRLMMQPNPLQTGKEFEAQQQIYNGIFGYSLLLPIIPVGWEKFGVSEATSMWNIPPYMIDVEETNKLFYQSDLKGIVKKLVLNYRGTRTEIDIDKVWIFKDFVPSMETLIFPESRIQALRMNINNIIGIYESLNQQINYAGAQGIFSPESDSLGNVLLKDKDIQQVQRDFKRYGFKKDQWKYVFSPAAIKWQQVGRPINEQMYLEQVEDNIMRICDAYNHPFRLVASKNNNSLGGTDAKVWTRNLYQDAIIPNAESTYEMWNRIFKTAENNCIIEKDFSHIDALQEDKLNNANAEVKLNEACRIEFMNNLITLNRWLEKIGEDTVGSMEIGGNTVDAGNMYYYQLASLGMAFGNSSIQNVVQNGTGTSESS